MLPPNIVGSLNNLTRAGILDCGTAAYVASGSSPYMCSPYRNRYSNLMMNGYNSYLDTYYNPNNKGLYSLDPRIDTYHRRNFIRRALNVLFVLGGVYLGGKGILRLTGVKSVAAGTSAVGAEAASGLKGLFSRIKNVFSKAGGAGAAGGASTAGTAVSTVGTVSGTTAGTASTVVTESKSLLQRIRNRFVNFAGKTKRIFKNGKFRPSY